MVDHGMVPALHIIEILRIDPGYTPPDLDYDGMLCSFFQPSDGSVQPLRKSEIGYRFYHIVQGIHRISADGILPQICDKTIMITSESTSRIASAAVIPSINCI